MQVLPSGTSNVAEFAHYGQYYDASMSIEGTLQGASEVASPWVHSQAYSSSHDLKEGDAPTKHEVGKA